MPGETHVSRVFEAEGMLPDFLKGNGAARIGAMAGVAAALTGFFLYIFGAISEPPKSVLYSGLDQREAGAVIQKLDAMQVAYDTKGDGGTILIAGDQVTKVRMQLAQDGLPSAGVGYEIFDKSDSFGTTAFVQNINRLRALEGELARSIKTIDGIESVRVHLVVPERQVFARDNQPPSASVVVKAHSKLSRGQVSAIQHLVAAAVSSMQPNSVAIVDDQGELLSPGPGDTGEGAAAAQQDEQNTQFEDRTRERVETIVASVVGAGHVRVQVSAEMDTNRITEQTETFDPDSKVVRSSQTTEETSSDRSASSNGGAVSVGNALPGQQAPQGGQSGDSQGSANQRTQETLNYEISHTSRTQVHEPGTVKRLSVAVVVDGSWGKPDANGVRPYTPRSAADMAQITALVRSAIGFNQQRGDTVQVTNMKFAQVDLPPEEPASEPLLGIDDEVWLKWGEVFLLCLTALLVFFFIVRPMIRRLTTPIGAPGQPAIAGAPPGQAALTADGMPAAGAQQAQIAGAPAQALPAPARRESMIDISQIEGQVRESAIRKVGEVVTAHPEEAMAILRTWLHEPA